MPTTTHRGFTQEAFDAFVQTRREPVWLAEQRRAAWEMFLRLPWPSAADEEWRRTDIRLFHLDKHVLPMDESAAATSSHALLNVGVDLAGQSVAVNSRPQTSQLAAKWTAQGVIFGSLDEIVHRHGDLVREHLFRRAGDPKYDRFAALHAAVWSGGHFLYVPRGVVVDEPLHALSVLEDGHSDLGHTLVILEDGAEATLMYETESPDESGGGFHCGGIELLLAPRSHLRYVSLQNWGHGVWHFAHQKAIVDRDASLQWTSGAIGGRLAKVNQHVALVGNGTKCQVNGVMFTEGRQHFAYHTLQHHTAHNCAATFCTRPHCRRSRARCGAA